MNPPLLSNSANNVPLVIAEIGCNHKGDMKIAKEMIINAALFCKVDIVKFQKRNPKELLSTEQYNAPHPNPMHAYGSSYGAHRERLEFTIEQHRQLKEWCDELNLTYSSSVWDLTSAKEIVGLYPSMIKVPSACNLNTELISFLCQNYTGEIHVSLGMTTHREEQRIVSQFIKHDRAKDLVIYACTSGYPVGFPDICLLEITRLKNQFGESVKQIGFSGHHLGIAADIAAMTLGATVIERHFTLDRTAKGTDHAASLEPDGMRKLKRDLSNVYQALRNKSSELLEIEIPQRQKLKHRAGGAEKSR